MDKVKVYLGYAQKYHFWILCTLAIIAGLVGWIMARGSLSEQYATNKGTVTGKFTTLTGIQQNQFPPNDQWTTAISALTKQEQEEVADTWKSVYDIQQKVLSWPDVLPANFRDWLKRAGPDEEMPDVWRRAYQTEAIKEFPELAKIVGAAPADADEKAKPKEGEADPNYKVRWENQDAIKKMLQKGMLGSTPSSFEIRLRQEDYWVLQALLNILRKTNEGALYTPRVKVIEELAIGADTAKEFEKGMAPGHITRLATAEGSADAGGGPMPEMVGGGEAGAAPPPDEGRYVDAEGKTLAAGTSQEQQFKRLPVYMKLIMDQREITRLLTECANYPLPVEVRQLRINPGGESGTKAQDNAGRGGQAGGRGGPGAAPAPGEVYDVTVEIHGIIYLFNPPDRAKLGAEEAPQAAG